ncbi:3-hydroxybutyryl-CoA dehydrogenase [Modicisalibacter muralis]|uniref:3-hydroxybutyryl-CoA dehydrogenase n=1 Tax=Modicisalibacter muralis TaxID=119000 RepID=A0A1G9KMP9_9GAMM|nr:3-hydroxyacyl-CoA dehydrogenase NAD-binding domain-containing protein [Halomonas muralis]SDL50929.1 3-hydroxybutyryl-CoA dehydrogenase [Halomonas muralis]
MSVARVIVVGAGTMGTAIADTFARAGLATALISRNPARLTGLHANIQALSAFPEAPPELIVEAIPEDIELKSELLLGAEAAYAGEPILASNSSGLPLQDIADRLGFPDRFLGIHYFHPARELPLVEVVRVAETSENTLADARRLLSLSGRDSVVMQRPVPGALINRLQHALLHEAYHLMSQGLASAEDIDKAGRWLLGPRMCISGLLEQKDIGGLEGHARAQRTIVPDLCHDARPNPLVQDMLARGDIGLNSGRGFYDWRGQDAHAVAERASTKLRILLAYLEENRS